MATKPVLLELISSTTREQVVSAAPVRSPDAEDSERMTELIAKLRDASDSVGNTVPCVMRNALVGSNEPCFDKPEALLGHAMLSILATKGFEIGSGLVGARWRVGAQRHLHWSPCRPTPCFGTE